tara:strand:- start:828 stop:1241 length:414 start_codon:yes stop_codon:yes gene_type:complete
MDIEIIDSEFRSGVVSCCCKKEIYLNTTECSGCLRDNANFMIKELTAFHKWLIQQQQGNKDPVQFLIELLRALIVNDQNQHVFELLDWVDIGENQFNRAGLKRVAIMLLDTNIIANDLRSKAVNSIPSIKQINNKKK